MIPLGPSLETSHHSLLSRPQAPSLVQNECFPPLSVTPKLSSYFSLKGRPEVWFLIQLLMRHLGKAPLDLKTCGPERSYLPSRTQHIKMRQELQHHNVHSHPEGKTEQSQVHHNSEILGTILHAP